MRRILTWILPGVIDGLLPSLCAWLNPTGAPGPLLRFEQWCDGESPYRVRWIAWKMKGPHK
jgi:hypothetical protein